jgi:hypothetical protein
MVFGWYLRRFKSGSTVQRFNGWKNMVSTQVQLGFNGSMVQRLEKHKNIRNPPNREPLNREPLNREPLNREP